MTRLLSCLTVAAILAPAVRAADPEPLARKDLDARILKVVTETINRGADIFNNGDHGGCYRFYQGSLMAVAPMLDHRPDLQKSVAKALDGAPSARTAADRAYVLRGALDELYSGLGGKTTTVAKTLYERLGGEQALKAVVDDFVARAATDKKVNFTRKGTKAEWEPTEDNVKKLKKGLIAFIGQATGGPQKYEGKSMKEVHKGMEITKEEFAALADDLKATLDRFQVPKKERDELLAIVASTAPDIIEAKGGDSEKKSLYERLGGEQALKAVVDDFVARAAVNAKVNFTRKGTKAEWKPTDDNVVKLKKGLITFIGQATGGPQKYEGKSMKEVHKGMEITKEEFDALAADLKATLDKFKVPQKEQEELLKIVGSTEKDIVEK
jgi:hemoglobin